MASPSSEGDWIVAQWATARVPCGRRAAAESGTFAALPGALLKRINPSAATLAS
jgi:hypothetical protein